VIEPGPRVLVLCRPAPDGSVPPRADLVLVDAGPGPAGTHSLVDIIGPPALEVLAVPPTASTPDVLVRPGPGPAAAALAFLRDAAGAAQAAGRGPATVVLDLGLDGAADEADALVRLGATADLVALGHPVAVALDGPAGAPEAVAVSAVCSGARVLRVPADAVAAARRTADVTAALVAERAGAGT